MNIEAMKKCFAMTLVLSITIVSFSFYKGSNYFSNLKLKSVPIQTTHATCEGIRSLKNIVLAVNYNFPHYVSVPLLKRFYQPVFGKVLFCGENENKTLGVIKIKENKGYQGYLCAVMAMQLYPGYDGYIHTNDDVLINWWNLIYYDQKKIWTGIEYPNGGKALHHFGKPPPTEWYWWKAEKTAELCETSFLELEVLSKKGEGKDYDLKFYVQQYYNNTKNIKVCINGWSDFYYVPKHFGKIHKKILQTFGNNKLYLEVAVPMSFTYLMNGTNHINLNGMYFVSLYGSESKKYVSGEAFYETYSFGLNFSHPFKLDGAMKVANRKFFVDVIMHYGDWFRKQCSSFSLHALV